MRLARGSVAAGLALVAALLAAGAVEGHSLPQSSDPSAGANLTTPPTAVTITFGEEPDPKLSTIRVLDTSGSVVSSGPSTVVPGNPRQLTVPLEPLGPGVYTVAWRTVSAVDGHLATGSFAFGVGVAPPSTAPGATTGSAGSASGGPSSGAIVGRWLLFLGLVGVVGGASFGLIVAAPTNVLSRRVLPLSWLTAAAGTITVVAVQLADAGVSLDQVFGTSFGAAILERTVPLLVAALGVVLVARRAPDRPALALAALGAGAALVVDVLLSHAAAGADVPLAVTIQTTHVLAVGLWLGGLAGLLVTVGRSADERTARAAKRFSVLATVGIATVATTGLLRALQEIGTLDQLVGTDFGRLVIAKTALLIGLAVLGAVNHFRNVLLAGRTLLGLRRVGSVELLVGGTVLLLSASLVNLAPPTEVAAAAAPAPSPSPSHPLVVDGSDFGTSVKVHLAVSPGTAGFDTFTATVTDYDSGASVAADGVSLRFVFPARSDVGSSRLDLAPSGPGVFEATGTNLSLDGTWQIIATVAHGTSSVEVPLELTTRVSGPAAASPTPTVDVNAVAGLPTIYTVHLSAGRAVQVYLDPGKPGTDDVHVTFFDAAGNELPVPSVAMALGPAGDQLTPLTPRELEPGHFVATTTLVVGTYSLSISGSAPNGDRLTTQIDIPVIK